MPMLHCYHTSIANLQLTWIFIDRQWSFQWQPYYFWNWLRLILCISDCCSEGLISVSVLLYKVYDQVKCKLSITYLATIIASWTAVAYKVKICKEQANSCKACVIIDYASLSNVHYPSTHHLHASKHAIHLHASSITYSPIL